MPDARLTLSPDAPDHLVLTRGTKVHRLPVHVTAAGLVTFRTTERGIPDVEVLGTNGAVMFTHPTRLLATGRDGVRTYGLETANG